MADVAPAKYKPRPDAACWATIKAGGPALTIDPKDQQAIYSLILSLGKAGDKEKLSGLVQYSTDIRRAEIRENARKYHYGQLFEGIK